MKKNEEMDPIGAQTITSVAKVTEGLLTRLFGPVFDQWGQRWANNASIRTLDNFLRNVKLVDKIVQDNQIIVKKLDLKVAVPYYNNVCLEEDDDLHNRWAKLIANYIDSSKNLTITVYPAILAQLSTQDFEAIDYMVKNDGKLKFSLAESIDLKNKKLECTPNLLRLGIISQKPDIDTSVTYIVMEKAKEVPEEEKFDFKLTQFGYNFLQACSR